MVTFFLPILAVCIGIGLSLILKSKTSWITKLLLSFSGAFLLALTLFELLPEVFAHLDAKQAGVFIMLGILLQIVLELFSKGAEHGHVHIHKDAKGFPWLLFVSLCFHSFLEGFPIHEHNDMIYGVLIHKIPIATLISIYLLQSAYSKLQIILFLVVFTFMTPLGALLANHTSISLQVTHYLNAVVIGIFFHISTTILFESGEGHKFNLSKFVAIILGIGIAYFI